MYTFLKKGKDITADSINDFIKLYEETFTEADEREAPDAWIERIKSEPMAPQPRTHLLLAYYEDQEKQKELAGGVIFEYYRASGCGLITYLVRKNDKGYAGLGKQLIDKAIAILQEDARASGKTLAAVLAECENPADFVSTSGAMPPAKRLRAFSRMGAKWLRFPYVQPALSQEGRRVSHLMLLSLPIDGRSPDKPDIEQLIKFLDEFYRALGTADPERDPDFQAMLRGLRLPPVIQNLEGGILPEDPAEDVPSREAPALQLRHCSVCLHLLESSTTDALEQSKPNYHYCPDVGSMELDLLSHAFRNPPVCNSESISYRHHEIEVHFPESFIYQTEGRRIEKTCAQPVLPAKLGVSRTRFMDSGRTVWHFAFMPTANNAFSEYDIIKLIHLYDGKSEMTRLADKIRFRYANEPALLSIGSLFTKVTNLTSSGTKAGTIQILTQDEQASGADHMRLLRLATQARDKEGRQHEELLRTLEGDGAERQIFLAYCGIVTGIFDFTQIDDEEAIDTLCPTFADDYSFIRIHRNTLVSVSENDRALEACWQRVGASPYLFLPHAVLIHNEEVIRSAEAEIDKALKSLTNRRTGIAALLNKTDPVNTSALERSLHLAERNLSHTLPNIFNYVTEKELLTKGTQDLGLTERLELVKSKLEDLKNNISSVWQVRRESGQMFIAILLMSISILQLKGSFVEFDALSLSQQVWTLLGISLLLGALILILWKRGVRRK